MNGRDAKALSAVAEVVVQSHAIYDSVCLTIVTVTFFRWANTRAPIRGRRILLSLQVALVKVDIEELGYGVWFKREVWLLILG